MTLAVAKLSPIFKKIMCITILPSFCQAIVISFDKEAFILVQYFDPEQPFVGCTDCVLRESFWPKGK